MSASGNSNYAPERNIYIYDMPHSERSALCSVLDTNDSWKTLAAQYMKFENSDVERILSLVQRNGSPAEELLTKWGNMNHTVLELFILLKKMNHASGMNAIKNLVHSKHHAKPVPTASTADKDFMPAFSQLKISNGEPAGLHVSRSSNEATQKEINVDVAPIPKTVPEVSLIAIPCISYQELVDATKNWNRSNCIGSGGFGEVYKGEWKYMDVAIKKIKTRTTGVDQTHLQQSLNELQYLNSCRHDNILPLYAYSFEIEPCLVYQYMSGGSLERRLYKSQNINPELALSWYSRLKIAIGTARGLQFLHTCRQKPLIHGDIKPANILLDPCNQPKIGDFGLVREGPNDINSSIKISKVFGTKPYIPPEFIKGRNFSVKVDTFSFGVVLFELATGDQAQDNSREKKHIIDYVKHTCSMDGTILNLIDTSLPIDDCALKVFTKFLQLGDKCTVSNYTERPYMSDVYLELDACVKQLEAFLNKAK